MEKGFLQWCFSNGKCEELRNNSVSAMGKWQKVADSGVLAMENVKNCRTIVFQQWENGEGLLTVVFQ
jgi:hypothetical protein